MWFTILKRLYDSGQVDDQRIINACEQGLITEEQKNIILGVEQ
jgi:hypothetical protein